MTAPGVLDRFRLDGRVAVVTGASVEKLGRRAVTARTDIADPADCRALIGAAMHAFGRVDILVNNAGISGEHPAAEETPERSRRVSSPPR